MEKRLAETQRDNLAELVVETLARELEGKSLVNYESSEFPVVKVSYGSDRLVIMVKLKDSRLAYVLERDFGKYRVME